MLNQLEINLKTIKINGDKYLYIKGSGKRIKFPRLNPDMSSLLGLISGDGYLYDKEKAKDNSQWRIGFTEDDIIVIKKFEYLVDKVFGIKPTTYLRKGTYFESYFNSRIVHEVLNKIFKFPSGKKINRLRIPKQVLSSRKYYIPFLRHLYSTDGRFIKYKNYPRIGVESATQAFLLDVERLLRKENFNPRAYTWNRKKGNKLYGLYLNGESQVKLFYRKIGFIGKKQKVLKRHLSAKNNDI